MPNFWMPLYKTGIAYSQKKDFKEASNNYGQALSLNPHHYMILFTLGDSLLNLGKLKEAESYLKKSMRKFSSNKFNLK